MPDAYVTVRDANVLGRFLGAAIVDITQHDREEYPERGAFIEILFDNGLALRIEDDPDGPWFRLTITAPAAASFGDD